MAVITVTEARARLPELLDRVEDGEEVTITRHGRPAATLTKVKQARNPRAAEAYAAADELRRQLEEARHKPLPEIGSIDSAYAEELVAEIRRDRDARG